ncbi:MAG TPA: nitroreductase family protein [Dehalococcoidia bacterium]|jgi:nitroreductase|nr:nitroreductase family protein [Chloroflexota bacterium]MDP5877991.1 nitroreductase family protein [Dehalococcoidia bacterium]MDP7213771.1 nitroreductase family protein [Dehalococcoidia bacterium]MDP7514537.1 nitroreductase family protein [Dehalococcoidia bacterium]HCV28257.1 nitroreductase family protein [Dehalococcoidia bacterium]|tara:strand:+ start:4463 stop:5131 length:669 start_codon:yes stop_codon:yes gene_type:complete
MTDKGFIPLDGSRGYSEAEMRTRAGDFYSQADRRRTVRNFSSRVPPRAVLDDCLRAAGTAPSGANMQPWHFAVVGDATIKRRIRIAAEKEEREFYSGLAPDEWLEALGPLGTTAEKPFLETAPWLIGIFEQSYGVAPDGERVKHYYVRESVGIATGILITALHNAGLATLTHTPSPMGFLNEIMERPANERPFLLLVVGYPTDDATVPDIGRKSLDGFSSFL